jgi:O-6-methylguanine DNA methyltransferase
MNQDFAIYETKLGYLKISYTQKAITGIERSFKPILTFGKNCDLSDKAISEINEYINGERKNFSIPFILEGTEFQKKVWNQLIKIPYGTTKTYKQIAELIGNPKACRAVGNANNKNPIAIVVPCHRVIGTNGKLIGYAGGLDMKEKLLEIEKEYSKK